jgi:hypothetical protein
MGLQRERAPRVKDCLAFGLLAGKPQKVSIEGTMRSRDVFAHSEARYKAVGRIARPESYRP